jgi:hypothetical protein
MKLSSKRLLFWWFFLFLLSGCKTGDSKAGGHRDASPAGDSDSNTSGLGETDIDTGTISNPDSGNSGDIDSDSISQQDTETATEMNSEATDAEAPYGLCDNIELPDDTVVVAPSGGDFESIDEAIDSGALFIHVTPGSDDTASFHGFVLDGDGQTVACAAGVTILGSVHIEGNDNTLRGCTITISEDDPVLRVRGSNNRAECNDLSLSMQGDGIWFSDGHDNAIVGNYLHDLLRSDVSGDPHSDCFQTWGNASNILFENNVCDHNRTSGSNQIAMIEAMSGDVTHLSFRSNIFVMHDEWYSPLNAGDKTLDDAYTVHDITIENNVFENRTGDGESAVSTWGEAWNVVVQRNVVIGYGSSARDYVQVDDLDSNFVGNNVVWKSNGDWPMTQFSGDIFADPATLAPEDIGFEVIADPYDLVDIGAFEQ